MVVSGSKDNSVLLWDVETGNRTVLRKPWSRNKNKPEIQACDGLILAVAISSDGRFVASGGKDKIIRIYDVRQNNTEIKTFEGHRDTVTSLSFRKDSYSLYSGSLDRTLKHWELGEMAYVETLFGHQVCL